MRKKIIQMVTVVLVLGIIPQFAFAGGVDSKQNWSAAYVSGPSRNAALDGADIAAYNPAGIVHLSEGLTCEMDLQFISINYDHVIGGVDYGVDGFPIVPSMFAVYKKDRFAVYGSFTVPGGGGEVEYEDGNVITQKLGNVLAAGALAAYGVPGGGRMTSEYAYVDSVDYGFTTGVSYAFTDRLSLSAGARLVIVEKEVDIHGVYDVGIPIPLYGLYDQEGTGFGGVFGLNYRCSDTVNIGLRYETAVNLDWETSFPSGTNALGAALLNANNRFDGVSYPRDLPAVLGLGVEFKVTPQITLKPSFTYYIEKDADWGTQNYAVDDNSYDLALSMSYQLNDQLMLSCGYMYTATGVDPNNYGIIEQMSPPLDCHTFAVGGKYRFNDAMALTFGAMGNFYVDDDARATYLAPGVTLAPAVEYQKTNYAVAVGLEYKFH